MYRARHGDDWKVRGGIVVKPAPMFTKRKIKTCIGACITLELGTAAISCNVKWNFFFFMSFGFLESEVTVQGEQ